MEFKEFKEATNDQFKNMQKEKRLYVTDVSKDDLWEMYLKSFPPGTNDIFRERTEHDCQCCKSYIRACGNVVAIIDNELVSIWDVNVGGHYQVVADALSKFVKSKPIKDLFIHYENHVGTDFNHQELEDTSIIKWEHFYCKLDNKFVKKADDIGTFLSHNRAGYDVFFRGLEELSLESIEIVLELIDSGSLYRGEEHRKAVADFLKLKKEYNKVKLSKLGDKQRRNFCWANEHIPASRIRNTAIGTLLTDISDGMELDKAVVRFESKVAPMNYKRPTAVVTKGMIAQAQKEVAALEIEDSLSRRYAVESDLTINNVLFADRQTKKNMGVFDELLGEVKVDKKDLSKVEKIDITTFIDKILPMSSTISLLFENKHANNLVSLISPQNKDAKNIFKWGNNFSWSYNGEVTDSIKEKVKRAGGNVEGVLRCSLSWFNYDDLDVHVIEPRGNPIYFGNKGRVHISSGVLDVDMNAGGEKSKTPVENIIWTNKSKMPDGNYTVFVNQYNKRETVDVGFDFEIEFDGVIHSFHYDKALRQNENVQVTKIKFSKKDGIKLIESLPSSEATKEVWGISTNNFYEVSMIMNSPNHWDGEKTGNKHYFFMLKDCKNEGTTRGFYNEFLNEELQKHRKVFEVLGSKMKVPPSNNQLSGLGFSSTQRNKVFCKVTGNYNRTVELIF